MRAGGRFCSAKTKLRSEEELKNGGRSQEMEEGRRRPLLPVHATLLPVCGAVTCVVQSLGCFHHFRAD